MSDRIPITNESVIEELRRAEVRPSTSRIHVLKYLLAERNHPTIDQIYRDLLEILPGLSRTSVYNTVSTLSHAGLVRPLSLEGSEMRYDAFTEDHGHFKCEACGKIFDIDADISGATAKGLDGFTVNRRDLFLWGLCPDCAKHAKTKQS
ncbi:MAG: transcriptional repressor [Clostridiales Family XIII bacterium]|jgi:Fe2+ or Zn2+ uptake regulation protein|nr:transcriptional repressor [Clostridiales Family XIII bacterium]